MPAALVTAARKRSFPLFEVPYELPFIAITERAFAQLVNERYEMLQRNMAGDVLAEALTGHLYPEDLQARLRPFGIGEQIAVLAFALDDPSAAAAPLERALERERVAQPGRDPRGAAVRGASTARGESIRWSSRASCATSSRRASARCARRRAASARRSRCG